MQRFTSSFDRRRILAVLLMCFVNAAITGFSQATEPDSQNQSADAAAASAEVLAGHSYHGEAFNEGPRQAAVLLEGMGSIDFPLSTKNELARQFFNQGVAALHGFWYLESERAFRQSVKIDPELAMAYWGMAMANANNRERAEKLILEAVKLRENASEHERLYIDALAKYLEKSESELNDDQKKEREQRYLRDLEKIIDEHPDDIEARAFLALKLWEASRAGVPIASYYAVDAVLDKVFAANSLHPAHHYRIHLWDGQRPENALQSSAMCGPSIPAIAHMWHMPGHIYSKLHRYADAAWQQEASARVDHSHMIRTRLMPDQIHNFAHNNEWLTRNLLFLGRVEDAVKQSRNLISLPQHPSYNSISKRGSFLYGRERLLNTLSEYELWQRLLDESRGPYLAQTGDAKLDYEILAWQGIAHRMLGNADEAVDCDWRLREQRISVESKQIELERRLYNAKKESTDEAKKVVEETEQELDKLKGELRKLDELVAFENAAAAVVAKDVKTYKSELEKAGRVEKVLAAVWLAQAGDAKGAAEDLKKIVDDSPGQVRPLAAYAHGLWTLDRKDEAAVQFEALRKLACFSELTVPIMERLSDLAKHVGVNESDWRYAYESPQDLGDRPNLDSLGPINWSPYIAPEWNAVGANAETIESDSFQGKPRIVIFYLGFGCLHCVEQLDKFKPMVDQFAAAGIELVGISNESLVDFQKGVTRYNENVPFMLLANPDLKAFHDYRCWDDFEDQPLHGTFLIDAHGRVRWQDIGYEPFTDAEFLLKEANRLLSLPNEN